MIGFMAAAATEQELEAQAARARRAAQCASPRHPEPYPPRSFEEMRLTAILERIEDRLSRIEAALASDKK